MSTLYIKNMVCDRCKMAVSQTLQQVGLHPQKVELGEVSIEEDPSSVQLSTLRTALKELVSNFLTTVVSKPSITSSLL